ncbi:MAG TPA: hypothetical protein PK122_06245, partial [Candidatus Paceibacterota bacterium]|nr:hypothetical protein [Candidatus Paceibacterota bacterium]
MAKREEVDVNITTKGVDDMNKQLKESQEAAKGLSDEFGVMDNKVGQTFKSLYAGATKGIAAMKTLKGAVMATGIGALAIAILSLTAYFTKTEEGAQKLRKTMAFLGAIFDKIMDLAVGLGRGIVSLKENFTSFGDLLKKGFQAILQNIINRFVAILDIAKAIGKLFKGDFKEGLKELADGTVKLTTGVADFTDRVTAARDKTAEWVKEVRDAAKAAEDLADRENKLKVQQRKWLVEQAKLEVSLSEARLKTGDATLTAQQRIEALNEAQRIQNEISDKQVQMAREAYEIQKERNGLASSTEEDLEKEAQLQADLIRIEKERNDRNKEFVDQRAGLLQAEI